METRSAIINRRAVKHYDSSHSIPDEEVAELVELARQAPTAFNIQNIRLVRVSDKSTRKKIREAAWDQAQVTDASLLFVVCADLKAWNRKPERYWENAPKEVQSTLVPMIRKYYDGREQVQRDEAMRSAGIYAQTLMLAATAMGYQSCPMDGFDFEKVGSIIKLPSDHCVCLIVVIGKGIQEAWPKPGFIPVDEMLIRNSFS